MKVEVKRVFFDNNGLHRVGEVVEVEKFDENLMKPIKVVEKVAKKISEDDEVIEKATKKAPTKDKH